MFSKKNIQEIPIEKTPHNSGGRRILAKKEEINSNYFEAFTYGYLAPKEKYSMHKHENIVEICLIIKGSGIIKNVKGEMEEFKPNDRFIFPSNTEHEIENTSEITAEFYFFRIQYK
ncbi:MAG: cupin domain-containing protein [Burkholderiales bacterium]|nr:cupin domain-containing protein [Burkholderiales bacterium]